MILKTFPRMLFVLQITFFGKLNLLSRKATFLESYFPRKIVYWETQLSWKIQLSWKASILGNLAFLENNAFLENYLSLFSGKIIFPGKLVF